METIDGTAEAGSDYKPVKDVIKFAAKEQLKDFYVDIIDDDIWEPDEFFFVKLSLEPNQNAVLGKTSINQVTIVNDDGKTLLNIEKLQSLIKQQSSA